MGERLSDRAIDDGITGTTWTRDGDTIVSEHEFRDFREAIAYVNDVATAAESANHHPDILVHGYNKVRLTLYTHSAGGLTQADLDMARTLDEVPVG